MYDWIKELKVVELASVLAGPLAGRFFAELGAEVIKIENPLTGGDVTRSWRLPEEHDTEIPSAYFMAANYGKEHHHINAKDVNGYRKIQSFISNADIVIANYRPDVAKKLQLDYASVRKINPGIIYADLLGFPDGRAAYDIVLQAESGFISMTGADENSLARLPVALIDVEAAHQLKEGILLAMLNKAKTGKGAYVRTTLIETAISMLVNQSSAYLNTGRIPGPIGTKHPFIAPYGDLFVTSDGVRFVLAVGNDKQFSALCEVMECAELKFQKAFINNTQRVRNRSRLAEILQSRFNLSSADTLFPQLLQNGIPFGEIKNISDALNADPARGMILHHKFGINKEGKSIKSVSFHIS